MTGALHGGDALRAMRERGHVQMDGRTGTMPSGWSRLTDRAPYPQRMQTVRRGERAAERTGPRIRAHAALPLLVVCALLTGGCGEDASSTGSSASDTPTASPSGAPSGAPPLAGAEPAAAEPWFELVPGGGGIDFRHVSGHDGETFYAPESLAGGAALVDLTGDGHLDAYLVQSGDVRTAPSDAGRMNNQRTRSVV